jgi:hypothetical protein
MRGIFQCRSRGAPHSLVRGRLSPKGVALRSLVNLAERNCERAEGDWQRQRPETEPDF